MRPSAGLDATTDALLVAAGIGLFVLARWAARRREERWADWLTLRVGHVLFTEVAAAFLIGYGVGGLLVPQLDATVPPGPIPVGRPTFVRPGVFEPGRLPVLLGIAAAAVAALMRIDLADLFLRGSSPGSSTALVGAEARVIAPIRATSVGEVSVRDPSGALVSAAATADTDIAAGTLVRIIGTRERRFLVVPRDLPDAAVRSG